MTPRILVITPVNHIQGVCETLESSGSVVYLEDPSLEDVLSQVAGVHAIFTNPNKSNVFIGPTIMEAGSDLRVICTASTGTNHIDLAYAAGRGITVLSLTDEHEVIGKITSTAEHAFALMMAALRRVPQSFNSVKRGEWDYKRFIGRQLDHVTVGVVGYGRLGKMFANYCKAFGSQVVVYDPYKHVSADGIRQVDLDTLLRESDVISIHVHVTPETTGMVDRSWFSRMQHSVVLVNTARGEVINEADVVDFLERNPGASMAVDVIADEVQKKETNKLIEYARTHANLIITPHVGGMTVEGQQIAYQCAGRRLKHFLENKRIGDR